MLQINARFVETIAGASEAAQLHEPLQKAIELEHSTIPPYLLAAYSLTDASNSEIRRILIEIAKEEMLHMAIVCNLLNAIGGRPRIGQPGFVPQYPGPLPMGVAGGLEVGLKAFSPKLVRDSFMKIEAPERPLLFDKVRSFFSGVFGGERYSTIGKFYEALIAKIDALGDPIFTGDPARQVTQVHGSGFPAELLYPIEDSRSAIRALTWIVQDGEGTSTSPLDGSGHIAHYYRFAQIDHGHTLIPDAASGYAYRGDRIPFDPAGVMTFPDNPKVADLPAGSVERRGVERFNKAYSDMLRGLDAAFDGRPDLIAETNSKMVALRGFAINVIRLVNPAGKRTGVSFEYVPAS